jgi:hypothetical protein
MRPPEQRVPFRPVFRDVAVGIDHQHAVFPPAHRRRAFPSSRSSRRCPGCRGWKPDQPTRCGTASASPETRCSGRRSDTGLPSVVRYSAAQPRCRMKTRFGGLGKNPLRGAPRPLLVARKLRQRLGPVGDDFVRPRLILATSFTGHGGESDLLWRCLRWRLRRTLAPGDGGPQRHGETENHDLFHCGDF